MKWITRSRPHVDRVACPWLIKKFVDSDAEFLYTAASYQEPASLLAVAERENATPFDVAGVELSHHGKECSFDAVIHKYGLTDPALLKLAVIVRGADTNAMGLAPECAGLEAIAAGFRLAYDDDQQQLRAALPVYDALYAYCQKKVADGK